MLSISPPRSAAGAVSYLLHLAEKNGRTDEYYTKEGDAGVWLGAGAEHLGLAGEVDGKLFAALAAGFDPDGTAMVQNAGDPERVAGWDLTFSAPKSVSIVWSLAGEDLQKKIEVAQSKAVAKALEFVEEHAARVRTGKGGEDIEQCKLVAAAFLHGTSRELDQQVHTHVFVFNQGIREDGSSASLDSREIFRWKMAAGAAYRAELSHELRQLGLSIERDGDSFRVAGVPLDLEQFESKRRAQIVAALDAAGTSGGAEAAKANLNTRKNKSELGREELVGGWEKDAEKFGFNRELAEGLAGPTPGVALELADIDVVLKGATEHDSIVKEQQIFTSAFVAAQGSTGIEGARELAADAFGKAIKLENDIGQVRYSTAELVQKEREIVENAQARQLETGHRLPFESVEAAIIAYEAKKGFSLSPDQREAVQILTSSGGVSVLVGDAGTGKSTSMEVVREAFESGGFRVLGTATGGKAAGELEQSSGIKSSTLESLLLRVEGGSEKITEKTVIVLDEAGMTDSRSYHRLDALAKQAGAKLIVAGDHKQLQAVGAGAPFRTSAERIPDAVAHLTTNQRQREDWRKEAVKQMTYGEAAKALGTYIDRGLVSVEKTHSTAVKEAARLYLADRAEFGAQKVMMVAATNKVVEHLNVAARTGLQKSGALQNEQIIKTGAGRLPVATGERIICTENFKSDRAVDLTNGDLGTVIGIHKDERGRDMITIEVDRTKALITIDAAEAKLRHGYAATAHRLQGATFWRVVALGSAAWRQEISGMVDTRAKDVTRWVFAQTQVAKMAREAAPTEKMANFARAVEATRLSRGEKPALTPESLDSVKACRQYLNEHSPKELPEAGKPALDPRLAELKEIVQAMSTSQQKESTLDYKIIEPTPAHEIEHPTPDEAINRVPEIEKNKPAFRL